MVEGDLNVIGIANRQAVGRVHGEWRESLLLANVHNGL